MVETQVGQNVLGIIGGSGLYQIDKLKNKKKENIISPFGPSSCSVTFGEIDQQRIVFLPRHGKYHQIPPSKINYRANIDVLKRAGCTDIISVSAVGSLKEELPPGSLVLVDQFIDNTSLRRKSFFDEKCVAHVSMADPVCSRLNDLLYNIGRDLSLDIKSGGTYLAIDGPQFSSRAESNLYRTWGCDVIGMTNMPEAKLAREAEICYATLAMVTDYDCWHENYKDVTVTDAIKVLKKNTFKAQKLLTKLAGLIPKKESFCNAGCNTALSNAIVTPIDSLDPETHKRLGAILKRSLNDKKN